MIRHTIAPFFLLACLLLGGSSAAGLSANLLLQLIAIPLIGWSLWQLAQAGITPQIRAPLALLAAFLVTALLQLVPMPPTIWAVLPGRGSVAEGYRLLGLPLPWLPLTLAPTGAVAALLWLLPAFAAFLLVIVLGAFRGRWIASVIIAVTLASIALGAVQVLSGPSAYLYEKTNYGVGTGFFSNPNHLATLILTCIPFLGALYVTLLRRASTRNASAVRLLVAAGYGVILVGILINGSLAGIGLAVPASLGTLLVFGRQRPVLRRLMLAGTVVASITALLIIVIGPFGNNLIGVQKANVEGSRQVVFAKSFRAASTFFPVGSGTATFQPIYRTMEPLSVVNSTYRNHVHNDWLELLLETGLAGIVVAALFFIWWASRIRAIWRADESDHFAQASVIATALILLHSLVDYPLRTAAISSVFAICLGLMSGVRPYVRARKVEQSARHLSI
ncbi:O-antigen ligase family protein [Sphingomonas sp. Mn802worker]|uniref:O-antigen ligase family protein n=1 Tax=Sphingomonas sp. Mn802worker TaxID=629773 RepID=UPI00037BE162|nr:O-antigen ligase family protein [Sphingomonas sp. Mn802worker]